MRVDKKCCKKVSNPLQILVKWAFIFLLKLYVCLEGVYEKNKMPLIVAFHAVGMEKPVPELSVGIAVIVRLHLPVRMIIN